MMEMVMSFLVVAPVAVFLSCLCAGAMAVTFLLVKVLADCVRGL